MYGVEKTQNERLWLSDDAAVPRARHYNNAEHSLILSLYFLRLSVSVLPRPSFRPSLS